MALQFPRTFGANNANTNAPAQSGQRKPPAQFWLNIGYASGVSDEDGKYGFVSLASGIALDHIDAFPTNSRNGIFAQFRQAQNALYEDIMAVAQTLKPGEERIIGDAEGLQIQLRRVNEELPQSNMDDNPFARRIKLG